MTYSQLMQTYMGVGTLAARPATPNVAAGVAAFYYATDTDSLYVWAGSAWHTITSGGPGSLATVSDALGADVSMTNANQFYDGPSVSCAAGTWLLTGSVLVNYAPGASTFVAKLWDGTTAYASTEGINASGNWPLTLPVAAIVSPTSTTTYRIGVVNNNAGASILAAATAHSAGNNASYLMGVQVG